MKKKTTFYDSLDLTEYIIWLFSMLWNNNFNPDFIEFKTPKTKFIYKQSDRYSYKYRNIENTYLTTAISDYEGSDMSIIINNWLELIDNYKNAFSTFFETLFNEHTTPSSAIKNYISVIDGLSKDFDVPSDGQTTNAQKIKKIKPIFDKIKPSLTSKEFNELKMAVLRESTKDIKCRFNYLIKSLSQYIQINLKDDFCPKVIETRNSITHPKSAKKDVFSKEQYIDVAFCLEKIIKAYLFMKIKVSPSAAKKILKAIEMPEI